MVLDKGGCVTHAIRMGWQRCRGGHVCGGKGLVLDIIGLPLISLSLCFCLLVHTCFAFQDTPTASTFTLPALPALPLSRGGILQQIFQSRNSARIVPILRALGFGFLTFWEGFPPGFWDYIFAVYLAQRRNRI